jgi:hypothetical protein
MKKYIVLSLSLIFVGSSLVAQNRETRKVESFSKIAMRVPGTLHLKQGTPQSVELQGDQDVLKEIETNNEGGKLVIEKDGKWRDWDSDKKLDIYVTVPNIEAVSVAGSGSVVGETKITATDLDLNVSGSGSLTLDIAASGNVDADVSGSGDIDLKGTCRNLDSKISGSGKVKSNTKISDTADFSVSGSGKIEASGSATNVKTSISGSGKVFAANLEASRCEVKISGSGTVEINVKDELDANISGSGSVAYKGNPSKVNSNSSGSGKVSKL